MAANGGRGCAGCEAAPWAELTAEMRRIKCAMELSYGKLAQRTHYSRSSWERFLNQKQLPTRIAVEQFAAAAGQDPRPLLIRLEHSLAHESAARATTGAPAPVPGRHGDGRHVAVRHVAVRQGGVRPGDVRPLGLVVAGALLGGLAAELTRAARLHRPR
ncbi:helix-turn-helix domain-containing protein [Streptomyces stackebrandtii]|uniref:helix-turn-helix domain-containing protein n=1 Tax=Streptomyces stackebrandtii TaxID=3051177 RepID=UPI0028DC9015|nr:helix-turn-helix domain-containing protein [Streptomyces sp. DSM 40976]